LWFSLKIKLTGVAELHLGDIHKRHVVGQNTELGHNGSFAPSFIVASPSKIATVKTVARQIPASTQKFSVAVGILN
jgi:hypothetical protein